MAPAHRLLAGALALSAVLIAACAPARPGSTLTTPGASPGSKSSGAGRFTTIDQVGPAPVVLANTAPDQLAAQVHLTMGGYDPATPGIAELSIVFLHGGHWVSFVRGERVTCNGLPLLGPGFDMKVPAETIGGKPMVCTYTSGASSASLTFTAPPAPAILSPTDRATIVRSHATLVRFRAGGQNTMFYITALASGTKSWVYPWGDPPTRGTANPPAQATIDTSLLAAGSGSITLVQSFTLVDLRGAGFQRVDGNGDAVNVVSVTWA